MPKSVLEPKKTNSKKRIGVFLNCDPSWGGQYQYTLNVLDAMAYISDREPVEVVAIYLYDFWKRIIDNYGFESCFLKNKGANAPDIIYKLGCDLIICPSEGIMLQEMVRDVPYISMIHDLMYHYNREKYDTSGIYYELRRRLYYKICALSEGLFVDSVTGKEQVVDLFGKSCEDNIFVQPFAVSKELLSADGDVSEAFKQSLPSKYLFYPAALRKEKNHRRLLEAIHTLGKSDNSINIVLSGNKGDDYDVIMDIIQKYSLQDQVKYIDYVSNNELVYLYKHARGMIFPTMSGPTNIPPVEAMAFECPMAVSDVGEMRLQVGEAGIFFDPLNIEEICDAMQRLWLDDDLCNRLKRKCASRYKTHYSPQVFNECFRKNYLRCIERLEDSYNCLNRLANLIKRKRIICYGAGQNAWILSDWLKTKNIFVDCYIDNFLEQEKYYEASVYRDDYLLSLSDSEKKECVIILCLPDDVMEIKRKELSGVGFTDIIVLERELVWQLFCKEKRYIHFL